MKNLIKKMVVVFSSLLLSSLAVAASFTVVNNTPAFISYGGFTEKNGDHILGLNCGPYKTCVVSDDQWDKRVTYITMHQNYSIRSYTYSISNHGSDLTNEIVLCNVYGCSLSSSGEAILQPVLPWASWLFLAL